MAERIVAVSEGGREGRGGEGGGKGRGGGVEVVGGGVEPSRVGFLWL